MGRSGLDEITAVTSLIGHSSAEVLNLISKRHAVYARGIKCRHDAISKLLTHMNSDAVVIRDDDDPNHTPRNCSTCISNGPERKIRGRGGQDSPI